jgi:hypothetical protein
MEWNGTNRRMKKEKNIFKIGKLKYMYICNIFCYSMMISGKFAITIHILTLLHQFPEEYLSSEFLASVWMYTPFWFGKK